MLAPGRDPHGPHTLWHDEVRGEVTPITSRPDREGLSFGELGAVPRTADRGGPYLKRASRDHPPGTRRESQSVTLSRLD
jgi:hypothetical protein